MQVGSDGVCGRRLQRVVGDEHLQHEDGFELGGLAQLADPLVIHVDPLLVQGAEGAGYFAGVAEKLAELE